MRFRVYADTSVIGGCFDDEFSEPSFQLINEFKSGNKILVLSDLTLNEISYAPERVKEIIPLIPEQFIEKVIFDNEAKFIAEKYLDEGALTFNYLLDAQHIALATISKVNVLVSWNFKHIVNLRRIQLYNSVNLKHGYQTIEIRTPREILNEEQS